MRSRRGVRVLPAFAGWPRTRVYVKKDRTYGYRVVIRVLTPFRAKVADALGTLTSIGVLCYGIKCIADHVPAEQQWPWAAVVVVGAAVSWPVMCWLWEVVLRRRTVLSYDPERLKRHGGWPRPVFDADYVDGFALREHPKAQTEALKHEIKIAEAAARRVIVRPKKYYQNSAMLIVGYHGEDRDVISIYRIHHAQKIAMRLQAIHQKISAQAASRASEPDAPDWTYALGEIS